MGKSFVDRRKAGEILIADGATATNYQQMGMAIGVAPEEWIVDQPEKVLGLYRGFIEAGSDFILTDTFGATSPRLRESRYAGRTTDLNHRAAALAREAASTRPGGPCSRFEGQSLERGIAPHGWRPCPLRHGPGGDG